MKHKYWQETELKKKLTSKRYIFLLKCQNLKEKNVFSPQYKKVEWGDKFLPGKSPRGELFAINLMSNEFECKQFIVFLCFEHETNLITITSNFQLRWS